MSAWRPRPPKSRRRYLGTWTLPSGNAANVYFGPGAALAMEWDVPPAPGAWPAGDLEHYQRVTFPEILRAVQVVVGGTVVGIQA